MTTLTRSILAHKRIVVVVWLILTVVGFASTQAATNALSQKVALPGQEGYTTNQAILHTYGQDPATPPFVPVVTVPPGMTVHSPGVQAQLAAAFRRVGHRLSGARIASYALAKTGDAHTGLVALERSGIGPGVISPFVVLTTPGETGHMVASLKGVDGVRGAVAPPSWHRGNTAIVDAFPSVDSYSSVGTDVVHRVRDAVHPLPGHPTVGGSAPANADIINAIYGSFPLMVLLIALITYVLLARAFRSLLLPLKAVLLNILSVGAAFGVMVLLWQDGYGSQAIWGIKSTGAINFGEPLMVFAFLFGLSMDYEVFLLARMREEYDETGSTNGAVIRGIGRTGRLVTSGALILFFAFIALAAGPQTDIKVFATGLAAGILLDATVVRMLLVPALVALFGRWNWWLPHLPARVLRVEPSHVPNEVPEAA